MDLSSRGEKFRDESLSPSLSQGYDSNNDVQGYTGQSMASAMKAKIMETPPMENRSRSDIACPLAAVILTRRAARGFSVKVEMRWPQCIARHNLADVEPARPDSARPAQLSYLVSRDPS